MGRIRFSVGRGSYRRGGGSAPAGRGVVDNWGVIDSTLGGVGAGGVGVGGFVRVGAAGTAVAGGFPFPTPCWGAGGGRGRGRACREDSQEHVQGHQACQHT